MMSGIYIETLEDGTIPLESVTAHFPGTTTIKYKSASGTGYGNPTLNILPYSRIQYSISRLCGVKSMIHPPAEGWDASHLYTAVNSADTEMKVYH